MVYSPKVYKYALNSQLQALQILKNDDEVESRRLSSFLLAVLSFTNVNKVGIIVSALLRTHMPPIYRPFRPGTCRQESFWNGCYITGTFLHMHRSSLWTFRQMDFSTPEHFDMGNFRHGEFSAQGIFGT